MRRSTHHFGEVVLERQHAALPANQCARPFTVQISEKYHK